MDLGNIFEGKLISLFVAGVAMLTVARFMKKGRLDDENPGAMEKILWAAGMLVTVSAMIFTFSRSCMPEAPDQDAQPKLRDFEKSSGGCGPRDKKLKDFEK